MPGILIFSVTRQGRISLRKEYHFWNLPCCVRIHFPLILFKASTSSLTHLSSDCSSRRNSLFAILCHAQIQSEAEHIFTCLLTIWILIFVNVMLTSFMQILFKFFCCYCCLSLLIGNYLYNQYYCVICLQLPHLYLHISNVVSKLFCSSHLVLFFTGITHTITLTFPTIKV